MADLNMGSRRVAFAGRLSARRDVAQARRRQYPGGTSPGERVASKGNALMGIAPTFDHMSNGEDAADDVESAEDAPAEDSADGSEEITEESLNERLDGIDEAVEAADTEADLDATETDLDAVESDLEAADLPEPDDEDEESPAEAIEARVGDLREEIEAARGPYASDVVDLVDDAIATIEEAEWTDRGRDEIVDAVDDFTAAVFDELDVQIGRESTDVDALTASLEESADAVEAATLDADEDADTIGTLLEAAETLESDLDDAEEWDDLETNEQLRAQNFYEVVGHYKDFPIELSALKEHEQRGNTAMVLLALDSLQSDFMETHCLEALRRMGKRAATDDAIDVMLQRAGKRDKAGIRILGKMSADEAIDTLVDYVDQESDPQLQKVTFRALGEIGASEAVAPLIGQFENDDELVRRRAARALGLIGDARAVDHLADVLADDDDTDTRTTAAWALRQIGTEDALEAVAEYTDETAFTVQNEAQKAADELDAASPSA